MKTVIGVCIDESGSMGDVRQQTIDAYNAFLRQQQEVTTDEGYLTLFKFANVATRITPLVPIAHAQELTASTYMPSGGTALYDALVETIHECETHGSDADRTIIVLITDGEENASRSTSLDQLLDLIAAKENTGTWSFVYLSASPQAFKHAGALGIAAGNTQQFDAHSIGTHAGGWSASLTNYRQSNTTQTTNFTQPGATPINPATGSAPTTYVTGTDWGAGLDHDDQPHDDEHQP